MFTRQLNQALFFPKSAFEWKEIVNEKYDKEGKDKFLNIPDDAFPTYSADYNNNYEIIFDEKTTTKILVINILIFHGNAQTIFDLKPMCTTIVREFNENYIIDKTFEYKSISFRFYLPEYIHYNNKQLFQDLDKSKIIDYIKNVNVAFNNFIEDYRIKNEDKQMKTINIGIGISIGCGFLSHYINNPRCRLDAVYFLAGFSSVKKLIEDNRHSMMYKTMMYLLWNDNYEYFPILENIKHVDKKNLKITFISGAFDVLCGGSINDIEESKGLNLIDKHILKRWAHEDFFKYEAWELLSKEIYSLISKKEDEVHEKECS